jgi:hypothetical protein
MLVVRAAAHRGPVTPSKYCILELSAKKVMVLNYPELHCADGCRIQDFCASNCQNTEGRVLSGLTRQKVWVGIQRVCFVRTHLIKSC